MRRLVRALVALSCLSAAGLGAAATINVPGDYAQIHDAVQAASAGDVVLVAPGTYTDCTHETEGPESTPACVIMKNGVTLRGSGQDQTIIDAEGLGRGIYIADLSSGLVENLQVRNSYAPNYGSGILVRRTGGQYEIRDVTVQDCDDGGVILIDGTHAVLRRLTVQDNEAKQGGGISVEEDSEARILDCVVRRNRAPSGAGVFIRARSHCTVSGCEITENVIDTPLGQGGGVFVGESSPTITNCIIENNVSRGHGGGLAYQLDAAGRIENCRIQGNSVLDSNNNGGGLYTESSNPVVEGCIIAVNEVSGASGDGGGVFCMFAPAATLVRCTIDANAVPAGSLGGGVAAFFLSTPTIDRCIITNSVNGGGVNCNGNAVTIQCSNIWNNDGGDALCGTDGGGNISDDPSYCGPGDYALGAGSPCLDVCGEGIGALPFGCSYTGVETPFAAARLLGNHPNPFNPSTTIAFSLDAPGSASVRIADVSGRTVTTLTLGDLPAGRHQAVWNGRDAEGRQMSSGVYLYELRALGTRQTRRMILIK